MCGHFGKQRRKSNFSVDVSAQYPFKSINGKLLVSPSSKTSFRSMMLSVFMYTRPM